MKLVHPDWKTNIVFKEGSVPVISIENPSYYSDIIKELMRQQQTGSGRFVLSDGNKVYDLSKVSEIIFSPFQIDFENKKIQSAIVKQIAQIAIEDEYMETKEIMGKLSSYIYQLTDYLDIDLTMNENMDVSQLIKMVGLKAVRDEDSLISQFTDYLVLLINLLHLKLIICINVKPYFSYDEMNAFYKTVTSKKIPLLLLESRLESGKIEFEDILIIDSDLCEI